jgi:hypothetical protein
MNRTASITVAGQEYELLLSTGAAQEIAERYDGFDKLGEVLQGATNSGKALGELIWLICLLANQPIQAHNLLHPEDKKALLTEEALRVLTAPADLFGFQEAITDCIARGTQRFVESEPERGGPNANGG